MRRRTGLWMAAAATAAVLLAGCAPTPPDDEESPAPETQETPTPGSSTAAPGIPEFTMPTQCTDILTPETAARFAADGRELLGGPGGVYGEEYFEDETPEEQEGGISCVWGDEEDLASTVVVSVAPLTTASRSRIVADLIELGLIESQIEGALTYSQIGDQTSAQAILNVIRSDSWISVVEAIGGEDRFQQATELVDEVTEQVYVVP